MLILTATIEDASKDYVLGQAWKKASNYIRYHNWFADTLDLEYHTANLPEFIQSVSDDMRSGSCLPTRFGSCLLPRAKSGKSMVIFRAPKDPKETVQLRPLAHVSLRDQIASTATMLYLADWWRPTKATRVRRKMGRF